MKKARTFPRQRVLILAFIYRELDRGDHALAIFEGLAPPEEVASKHKAVVRRWVANIDRLRVHRDSVEGSTSRTRLVTVLDRLNRSVVETKSRRIEAGLRRLGGTACDIERPQPVPQVFLPRVRHPSPGVESNPGAPSSAPRPASGAISTAPGPNGVAPDADAPDSNVVPPQPNVVPPEPNVVPPSAKQPNTVPPRMAHPPPR